MVIEIVFMQISKTWNIGVFKEEPAVDFINGVSPQNLIFTLSGREIRTKYRHNAVYADPFLFVHNNRLFLFTEIQPIGEKGFINGWEYKQDNDWTDMGPLIKESTHFSYPFIFRDKDQKVYMIPESCESKEISLWFFSDFPKGLKKIKTILKGSFVDSNILLYNDVYYVFTKKSDTNEQLIFFSKDLMSDTWTPHPANPITTDSRINRNGGGAVIHNGNLIRIAQNNSEIYGGGIVIMTITKLDIRHYEESVAIADYRLKENYTWQKKGRHHLSFCNFNGHTYIAIDGLANNKVINIFINGFYKILGNVLYNRSS